MNNSFNLKYFKLVLKIHYSNLRVIPNLRVIFSDKINPYVKLPRITYGKTEKAP